MTLAALIAAIPLSTNAQSTDALTITRQRQDGPDLINAELTIPASTTLLVTVLETPCHVLRWMPDLTDIRVLNNTPEGSKRVYMQSRGTLFSQPRDSISLFTKTGGTPKNHSTSAKTPIIITMQAQPDALPEQPGTVRIPFAHARWSLSEREASTLLTYQQEVAAGGNVPQWLADQYSVRFVRNAMESLTKYVATLSSSDCPAIQ